ncbi:MAG TPA: GntR family transcriptional regulator [Variovorax sp.]|nr:GntR family transcriptional regulator [Variovorax sp.]
MHASANPQNGLTLASHIRRTVIEDISQGALAPGTTLDEQVLCTRFQASRTPVREAMLQLAAEGFVTAGSRSGVVIPKLSIARLRELLELLAEMEAAAAKFATRRLDGRGRDVLREAFGRCEAAAALGDAAAYQDANDRFHQAIHDAARNETLTHQIHSLRTRCAAYTHHRFESPGRIGRSLEEHRHLLAGIESGDPARGHAAMLDHIAIGGRDFAEFVSRLPPAYVC